LHAIEAHAFTHHKRNPPWTCNNVPRGDNVPNEINVIIEIPSHAEPVKYEMDKDTGAMFVDRFMSTAMTSSSSAAAMPAPRPRLRRRASARARCC
jgi:hypothetical protein